MAGCYGAGGAWFFLQMEHGLDARHARLCQPRAGSPPLASQRDDVRAGLCVVGEVRSAAVARRSRAWEGLALRSHAWRYVAEARQPARLFRVHVDTSRKEAVVHGRRACES